MMAKDKNESAEAQNLILLQTIAVMGERMDTSFQLLSAIAHLTAIPLRKISLKESMLRNTGHIDS